MRAGLSSGAAGGGASIIAEKLATSSGGNLTLSLGQGGTSGGAATIDVGFGDLDLGGSIAIPSGYGDATSLGSVEISTQDARSLGVSGADAASLGSL